MLYLFGEWGQNDGLGLPNNRRSLLKIMVRGKKRKKKVKKTERERERDQRKCRRGVEQGSKGRHKLGR